MTGACRVFIVIFYFMFGAAAVYSQTSDGPLQHFDLTNDTDYLGGDIKANLDGTSSRDLSVSDCASYCYATSQCVGFTYNENVHVCLPKGAIGLGRPFRGAISGVRRDLASAILPDQSKNDFSSFLLKSRCDENRAAVKDFANAAKVIFADTVLTIKQPASIQYVAPATPDRLPVFLVFSFDQPVRFRGAGFYVLSPQAAGAFGTKFELGKTRVVIPLYAKGRSEHGDFSFVPLTLAPLQIKVSVLGQNGCKEQTIAIDNRRFETPTPSPPKIFVYDQYSAGNPSASFQSPAGDRYIDVYPSFFRIKSTRTGALIAEVAASKPNFSPTGRFVTAVFEDGVHIIDAVDGAGVGYGGQNTGWDLGDSFVVADSAVWGSGQISQPLVESDPSNKVDNHIIAVGWSCHACSIVDTVAYKLDLENNYLISVEQENQDGGGAVSLTTGSHSKSQMDAIQAIHVGAGIVPATLPKRWETRSPLQFTNLSALDYDNSESLSASQAYIAKHFMVTAIVRSPSPDADPMVSVSKIDSGIVGRLIARIGHQYGVKFAIGVEPEYTADALKLSDFRDQHGDQLYQHPFLDRYLFLKDGCTDSKEQVSGREIVSVDNLSEWKFSSPSQTIRLLGIACQYGTSGGSTTVEAIQYGEGSGTVRFVKFDIPSEEYEYGPGGCNGDCGFSAQLVDDRFVVMLSPGSAKIDLYDLADGKLRRFLAYHGKQMVKVLLTQDHSRLLQVNSDGTFALYATNFDQNEGQDIQTRSSLSIGGAEEVSASIKLLGHFDNDELVVWSPDGYFDSTYEGLQQIFLKFDGMDDQFTFDQFSSSFRKMGLFEHEMTGQGVPDPPAQYRIPPIITMKASSEDRDIKLTVDQLGGGKAKEIWVYQDGKRTDRLPFGDSNQHWSGSIRRGDGVSWIAAVAVDENGLTSTPQNYYAGQDTRKRDAIVLALGVNKYSDPNLPSLQFGEGDASRFSQALSSGDATNYRSVQIVKFDEPEVSGASLIAKVRQISGAANLQTDLIFYFSGHGLTDENGRLYLGLSDSRADDLSHTAVSWTDIAAAIESSKGRSLILLDTCHSGEAAQSLFSTNDSVADTLLGSGDGGVTILAASKGRENSFEAADEGGGLFTTALLKALGGRSKMGTQKDAMLEISEFYRKVKGYVTTRTDGRQTPWLATSRAVGEFSIL
ncbi:hypothetical protein GR212_32720 [Rhizobium lusitanum]|uniref:Peptidase C14 caspase domain-containing protein n=1 Tax=Rhizobium lusitanum TaxID=293958 RepID=A0A6L9UG74_9HYPH|nr:caspase family protein [Rhizobium lusitanum]NEI74321.1 hypothetical protein [Rhizobium lusitanum]